MSDHAELNYAFDDPTRKNHRKMKDPETGMFENIRPNYRDFNVKRKLQFLELLKQNPSLDSACRKMMISPNVVRTHYLRDPEFQKRVNESTEIGKSHIKGMFEDKMIEYGNTPKGFMHMMAWLRRYYPGEYNETKKVEHKVSTETLTRLENATKVYEKENNVKIIDINAA